MCAGSFRVDRAAVVMGVVVASLLIANHLEWLAEVHYCRGEPSEAGHPLTGEKKKGKGKTSEKQLKHLEFCVIFECSSARQRSKT